MFLKNTVKVHYGIMLFHMPRSACFYSSLASKPRDEVLATIESRSVWDAWAFINAKYLKPDLGSEGANNTFSISSRVPNYVMTCFYRKCVDERSPLAAHYFSQLVKVDIVGKRYFPVNCDRLVQLLLAHDQYEAGIGFIQKIELANRGKLPLEYKTLESLLIAAKWHNDVEFSWQIMQILVNSHSNVYARTWGLFFQLCLDMRDHEALKWIHKTALIPGNLVIDNASYLRLAEVAAEHGNLRLCEWASLHVRRRQRALGAKSSPEEILQLYVSLIEAAAKCSQNHQHCITYWNPGVPDPQSESQETTDNDSINQPVSFETVCRYLIKIGAFAKEISVFDLPQTTQALATNPENMRLLTGIYDEITAPVMKKTKISPHYATKTLIFNLLLHVLLKQSQFDAAKLLASEGRDRQIAQNEDSVLIFLDLGRLTNTDRKTLQTIAMHCPTPKVTQRANNISKFFCT